MINIKDLKEFNIQHQRDLVTIKAYLHSAGEPMGNAGIFNMRQRCRMCHMVSNKCGCAYSTKKCNKHFRYGMSNSPYRIVRICK